MLHPPHSFFFLFYFSNTPLHHHIKSHVCKDRCLMNIIFYLKSIEYAASLLFCYYSPILPPPPQKTKNKKQNKNINKQSFNSLPTFHRPLSSLHSRTFLHKALALADAAVLVLFCSILLRTENIQK